jgi:hypothetical protein
MIGGCAAPEADDGASTPPPRYWLRCGTLPQHSSGRQRSGAWRIRRRGCHLATLHNPRWTDECRDNPSSRRQCRRTTWTERCGEEAGHSREVWLSRVMDVEAHLLDRVGDFRPDEDEALESPDNAMVASRSLKGHPCQRIDCPRCQPEWRRACSRSCQRARGCLKRTHASGGRGRRLIAPPTRQGGG